MREFFGWTKSSRMPEIYVHLSGRDVDSTLLRHYGVKVEMPKEDVLGPGACPLCKAINSPSARFCQKCNTPLDPASADKAMDKQRRKEEVFERWLNLVLQGETPENATREMRREIEELAAE